MKTPTSSRESLSRGGNELEASVDRLFDILVLVLKQREGVRNVLPLPFCLATFETRGEFVCELARMLVLYMY